MNWRTDKPTADIIVVFLKGSCYPQVLEYDKEKQCYLEEHNSPVNIQNIEKWADLEEDETVTAHNELEEEIDCAIDDLEGVAEKSSDGELIAHLTPIEHLKGFARHFYNLGKNATSNT